VVFAHAGRGRLHPPPAPGTRRRSRCACGWRFFDQGLFDGDLQRIDADLQRTLPKLERPTLLIWGSADPIVEEEVRRSLREALPHAQVKVFPGLGTTRSGRIRSTVRRDQRFPDRRAFRRGPIPVGRPAGAERPRPGARRARRPSPSPRRAAAATCSRSCSICRSAGQSPAFATRSR